MDHNQTKKLFENWTLFLNEAETPTPEKFEKELESLVLNAKSENPNIQLIISRLQEMERFVREENNENPNNAYDMIFYIKKEEISKALQSNRLNVQQRKGPSIGVDRTSYRPLARKKTKEFERMQALDRAAKARLQLHGTGTTYDLENREKIIDISLFILGLEDAEDFDSIDWAFWVATWVVPVGFLGKIFGAVFRRGARQAAQQARPAVRRLGKMAAKDKRLRRQARSQQRRASRRLRMLRKSPAFKFISSATKSKIYKLVAFASALTVYLITLEWMQNTLRSSLYDEDDLSSLNAADRKELKKKLEDNKRKQEEQQKKNDDIIKFLRDFQQAGENFNEQEFLQGYEALSIDNPELK